MTMRDHYDFSKGERGKYAKQYREGVNLVLLDPEVAKAFPTAEAVNAALRKIMSEKQGSSKPGDV